MSAFQRHNIQHISASSLALFRAQPALWCLKYLAGFKDEAGPAAWRGSAVEAGLTHWLYRRNEQQQALDAAYGLYLSNAQGELSDEIEAERALISPMFQQAILACKDLPHPIAKQLRIECRLDGVDVPVVGYLDILTDTEVIDLKTTKACPSEVKPDHRRQVALYVHSRGNKEAGKVLYVTAKKFAIYSVENVGEAVEAIRRDALALQRFLGRVKDGPDALGILPADLDSFYWSDAAKQALLAA